MRIRYTIPFKRKIIIDDHWEIPMQGGRLRIIEENDYATAIELTFEKQPLEYAPSFQKTNADESMTKISNHDQRIMFVKRQLDDASAFLECFHDIELITEEIEAKYEGETPEEETQLSIKGLSMGRHDPALTLNFDMLTRAVMAAEKYDGPKFEVAFVKSARKMLKEQKFINSFRYSFLLIESLYGNGQFKTQSLQTALKSNNDFRAIVELAIKDVIPAKNDNNSDTAKLLMAKPEVDSIINHLVEKRGFYFHGNIKRRDAWNPNEQNVAESLALLAIGIATTITIKAADPLFIPELEKRHFENAIHIGAKLVFEVKFRFREPEEAFDRHHQFNITMPGTKLTPRTAFNAAQYFLNVFQHNQPASVLYEAECNVQETGEKVFTLIFHTKED
ncbi:hypothetical protein ACRU1U_12920 [Providencia stuartii]|nr:MULTISPECIES: hypothetical protein [Providencia]MBG5896730.1 hypothetical protein [Providencia stuartii]MBK1421906.1 hypothetical protein [Providencia stuartii]MDE8747216.1 hypothetical protein [Providencia thailandensis]MDE8766222.1 hypothetical protein [Providencia thailandensis]MDE8778460.1 hypothetical protein [Providencia thailandensis]